MIFIRHNYDAGCTFCNSLNLRPVPQETVGHIFWDCIRTNNALKEVSRYFLGFEINKKEWFYFDFNITKNERYVIGILLSIIKYVMWSCKLRKKLINTVLVTGEVNFHLEYIFMTNRTIKTQLNILRQNLIDKRRG